METNNKSRVLMGTLCMLASTICYGFISTISIKALNAGAATETILFDKFLYAAILIWAYIFIKKIPFKIEKNQILMLIVVIVSYNMLALCLYEAFNYIPGNLTIVLNFTYPAMIIVFEALTGRARFSIIRAGSILFSVIGFVLIVCEESITLSVIGIAFAIGAAVSQACYVIALGSDRVKRLHPIAAAGYVTAGATVFNLVRTAFSGEPVFTSGGEQLAWTLVLSFFCAFLAILLFCIGVNMIGSGKAAVINTLEPVVACVAGYVFLSETMTFTMALGCVAIVIAVFIINFDGKKPKHE